MCVRERSPCQPLELPASLPRPLFVLSIVFPFPLNSRYILYIIFSVKNLILRFEPCDCFCFVRAENSKPLPPSPLHSLPFRLGYTKIWRCIRRRRKIKKQRSRRSSLRPPPPMRSNRPSRSTTSSSPSSSSSSSSSSFSLIIGSRGDNGGLSRYQEPTRASVDGPQGHHGPSSSGFLFYFLPGISSSPTSFIILLNWNWIYRRK